jgi:hypothetical protein
LQVMPPVEFDQGNFTVRRKQSAPKTINQEGHEGSGI